MKDFRNLKVWQKSHELTLLVYKINQEFSERGALRINKPDETFIKFFSDNIAEGCGRQTNVEFSRFLQIAFGSASELEYQLLLTRDLCLLNTEDYYLLNNILIEIKKMLASLISKVRSESSS